MSRIKPQKITVKYDDGSRTSASFDSLTHNFQQELLRQPAFSKPSPSPEDEKYLLLEWEDGWREVIEVDTTCEEINRYYVISRSEDVGRISLNKKDGYPELIEIIRKPLNLKKITFMDTFQLDLEKSIKEGKKVDHFFTLTKKGDALSQIKKDFTKAVEEDADLVAQNTKSPDQLQQRYERIRRKIEINAGLRQQDVFDFIAYLEKTPG